MTASRFAWVFNLDAEFELARPGYLTPKRLQSQLDEYGRNALALMAPDDVLASPGLSDASNRIGRAWCPTTRALAHLRVAGVKAEPHPRFEVLRRVNHRRFAVELGGGLGRQVYSERLDEIEDHLERPPPTAARGWLLKRPLAFAGRGQLRISGPLDATQRAWVFASLKIDGLVVEPWVTPALEISLHGFVQPDARFALGAPCVQSVSARGAPQSVVRAPGGVLSTIEAQALRVQAARVARALAEAGYFGPFGIDAYRYESGFCTLSEINARYTLGFAVGFGLPPLLSSASSSLGV